MELRGARVAVTGATGFLGRYVVEALLGRGSRVVGVVRNPGRVPALAARIELRAADLADPRALAAGFAEADAVVSNAALFSLRNARWEDHQRANVEGTTNVFDAAAAAGVSRIVHVSSVAVYAESAGCVT
jgi:dihydroflavonol-4-reductase